MREEQRALFAAVLGELRRRLRLELLLELAADALIVLAATALDPRLPRLVVSLRRAGPASSCWPSALAGVLAFLGIRAFRRWQASRLDELTLAMTLDRHRPGTGQQIADVLQLPELLDESGVDRLAGDGAAGRPARLRGPGRLGLALALEPQADGSRDRWP